MSELKPCPFCGDAELEGGKPFPSDRNNSEWIIRCGAEFCGAEIRFKRKEHAIAAWNFRKPEPGQPAALQCSRCKKFGAENTLNGVEHVCNECLFDQQPAAGQSEPVAKVGLKAHTLEWLSDEAFDSVPIGALLYTHPIPAAPAVPEGWKFRKMDFGIAITQPGKGPYCALPQGHRASSLAEAILNNLGMAILAASPNQQDVAK